MNLSNKNLFIKIFWHIFLVTILWVVASGIDAIRHEHTDISLKILQFYLKKNFRSYITFMIVTFISKFHIRKKYIKDWK